MEEDIRAKLREAALEVWPWVKAVLDNPKATPAERRRAEALVRKYGPAIEAELKKRAEGAGPTSTQP